MIIHKVLISILIGCASLSIYSMENSSNVQSQSEQQRTINRIGVVTHTAKKESQIIREKNEAEHEQNQNIYYDSPCGSGSRINVMSDFYQR